MLTYMLNLLIIQQPLHDSKVGMNFPGAALCWQLGDTFDARYRN